MEVEKLHEKNKVIAYIFISILVLSIVVVGCQPAEEKPNEPNNNYDRDNNNYGRDNNNNYGMNNNDIYDENDRDNVIDNDRDLNYDDDNDFNDINNDIGTENNMVQRAELIANKVARMTNVEDASVVITNNTALVGVDITNGRNVEMSQDMRTQIERTVRNADRRINNVVVTAEPDIFDRIGEIGMDIRRGRPMTGYTNEIEKIMRRITPNL